MREEKGGKEGVVKGGVKHSEGMREKSDIIIP